jgi:hypothetical protein
MLREKVSLNTKLAELSSDFEEVNPLLPLLGPLLLVRGSTLPRSVIQVVMGLVPIPLHPSLLGSGEVGSGQNQLGII